MFKNIQPSSKSSKKMAKVIHKNKWKIVKKSNQGEKEICPAPVAFRLDSPKDFLIKLRIKATR